jgi:hypothetical protein
MYMGGVAGASDSMAAALWALDYLSYYAHETPLAGVNFHNAPGASYNAFAPTQLATAYSLRGVGYGLMAFARGGRGRPLPRVVRNPHAVNLTAYALLHDDGTETVCLVNKTHGAKSTDATVELDPGRRFAQAEVMYLAVANDDAASATGITLGGAPVAADGTWSGGFTSTLAPRKGRFTVPAPHTQAAIVHFY